MTMVAKTGFLRLTLVNHMLDNSIHRRFRAWDSEVYQKQKKQKKQMQLQLE
jgi:hypothetical protein